MKSHGLGAAARGVSEGGMRGAGRSLNSFLRSCGAPLEATSSQWRSPRRRTMSEREIV
jgi:hypothetical protein